MLRQQEDAKALLLQTKRADELEAQLDRGRESMREISALLDERDSTIKRLSGACSACFVFVSDACYDTEVRSSSWRKRGFLHPKNSSDFQSCVAIHFVVSLYT